MKQVPKTSTRRLTFCALRSSQRQFTSRGTANNRPGWKRSRDRKTESNWERRRSLQSWLEAPLRDDRHLQALHRKMSGNRRSGSEIRRESVSE
ncbi:hypothetical protein M758_7G017700 [Ceratodon purpureus]|nr:hypothetical protein M758_7G017700 [Ceratodon purpureus]